MFTTNLRMFLSRLLIKSRKRAGQKRVLEASALISWDLEDRSFTTFLMDLLKKEDLIIV